MKRLGAEMAGLRRNPVIRADADARIDDRQADADPARPTVFGRRRGDLRWGVGRGDAVGRGVAGGLPTRVERSRRWDAVAMRSRGPDLPLTHQRQSWRDQAFRADAIVFRGTRNRRYRRTSRRSAAATQSGNNRPSRGPRKAARAIHRAYAADRTRGAFALNLGGHCDDHLRASNRFKQAGCQRRSRAAREGGFCRRRPTRIVVTAGVPFNKARHPRNIPSGWHPARKVDFRDRSRLDASPSGAGRRTGHGLPIFFSSSHRDRCLRVSDAS